MGIQLRRIIWLKRKIHDSVSKIKSLQSTQSYTDTNMQTENIIAEVSTNEVDAIKQTIVGSRDISPGQISTASEESSGMIVARGMNGQVDCLVNYNAFILQRRMEQPRACLKKKQKRATRLLSERVLNSGQALVLQNLTNFSSTATAFEPVIFTASPSIEESKEQSPSIPNSASNTLGLKKKQSLTAAFGVNMINTGASRADQMQENFRDQKGSGISPGINASQNRLSKMESFSKPSY